ncbi:MAG: hypothetical protein ABFR89_12210 [Actinomycetota bacterium]
MNRKLTLFSALVALGLFATACSSEVSEDTAPGASTSSAVSADSVGDTTTTLPDDSDSGDNEETPPPPAEDSGTVTWQGETNAITEFPLCETVNPAFEGDFNIQIVLPDGTDFSLMGNIDDYSADHQGLRLGELPNEEYATSLTLELNGRNLSGTGQTSLGPIEFSFDC